MKFEFAPLARAMGLSEGQACRVLNLSGSTAQEYRRDGMSERVADRLAVKAGFHPAEVWPEIDRLAEVKCASNDCDTMFVPRDTKGHQKYCSDTCRNREKTRRYRATPAGAESARRVRRNYYWSDPRIREREAELRARPSARRADAARQRERRAALRARSVDPAAPRLVREGQRDVGGPGS